MSLYEGMFLIDNDLVRSDWNAAKAKVTDVLTKHGATLHTARRWDERQLAYTIRRRKRATYLLSYFELDNDKGTVLNRDLELADGVLRHLVLRAEEVPVTERELATVEQSDDFTVPPPPEEDAPVAVEEPASDDARGPAREPKEKVEKPEKSESGSGAEAAPEKAEAAKPEGDAKPEAESGETTENKE